MARLGLPWFFCMCAAAASLAEGREKPAGSRLRLAADAPEHDDVLVLLPGQCLVRDIALFDGAMWSPQPCSVCRCQRGAVSCRPVPCAGSNNQQSGAPRAKKLDDKDDRDDKDGLPERRKSPQRRRGSSNPSATRGVQEVKPRKEERIVPKTPPPTVKPVVAKRKPKEVKVAFRGDKPVARVPAARPTVPFRGDKPVARVPAARPTVPFRGDKPVARVPAARPTVPFRGDKPVARVPAARPTVPFRGDKPVARVPAARPTVPFRGDKPVARVPAARPTVPFRGDKPVARVPAARPSVPARTSTRDSFHSSDEDDFDDDDDDDDDFVGPPLVRATGRPAPRAPLQPTLTPVRRLAPAGPVGVGRLVVTFPSRPSFMESLPAGCLLSESLIACGSTGLAHMPIITDQGVRILYLADNRISKIPPRALAGLPNLEWLDLSKNKLDDSSISPLLFQNLTKLRRLILDGNNLTKVPAFLPPSLVELKINDNRLSGLTPSSFKGKKPSLVELKINDNRLSGLTPSSFKGLSKLLTLELEDNYFHDGNVSPLTFRPLKKLIYLRLEDNKFRAIPSGLPASLQELHLSDNKIEVVHAGILNKTVNLRVLDLSHNRLREDRLAPRAWIHLLKLESLDLSHNKLVHVPSFLPAALHHLLLHHNQIERIPGYVFGHMRPGLDSLHLSHNRLRDDGVDNVSFVGLSSSLAELLLDHNQLRSVPRGMLGLKNLQLLRLNHNFISHVPMNALCDTNARDDSPLVSVHLQYNLIQRRLIPPTAFSCIKNYHGVLLRPQSHEDDE